MSADYAWIVHRLDCQTDLSSAITRLNPKSKLFVVREAPQTVLAKLFKAWKISHVVFEKDTDAYARDRDAKVMEVAKEAGVEVIVKTGRTLYDPDELVKANGGRPTMSITQVQNVRKPSSTSTINSQSPGGKKFRRCPTPLAHSQFPPRPRRHHPQRPSNSAISRPRLQQPPALQPRQILRQPRRPPKRLRRPHHVRARPQTSNHPPPRRRNPCPRRPGPHYRKQRLHRYLLQT